MSLQENISLRPHNTFGIDVKIKKLAAIKNELKGNYFITAVTFRLSKQSNINTTYGTIQ